MTKEQFTSYLRVNYPSLYVVLKLQEKFLEDMYHGEIKMTMHVQNKRVTRVTAVPEYSELVDKL